MFEKLKRKYLKRHTDRNLMERDLSQVNAKLKTLGFLVDESVVPDYERLYDFSKTFGLVPKNVQVFTFIEVKKKLPSLRQNQIDNKDFNWKGEINNQNALEFLENKFDMLVALYDGKHEFLDLMVSRSMAKFKVGSEYSDPRLFDLLIHIPPQNLRTLEGELVKYVTILNKI